jgi:hypothetical protein
MSYRSHRPSPPGIVHPLSRARDEPFCTLDFVTGKENVIFLGPPGTGKRIWRSGWVSGHETGLVVGSSTARDSMGTHREDMRRAWAAST